MWSRFPAQFRALASVLGLLLIACGLARAADTSKTEPKVSHSPKQPKSGERVTIKVEKPRAWKVDDLVLQYQVVEPGKYIAFADPAYARNWTDVKFAKAEKSGGGDPAFTAELPAEVQQHRRIVRYRIWSSQAKAVVAPAAEDAQHNFAYFVYDGVPEWRAAINPKASGDESKVVTFDAKTMRSVQAYHLISKKEAVENVTWYEPKSYMDPAASEYKYTGTFVANGKVYDHIRFRCRGGSWRHAMGKNMWKIDFLKGHHLEARDNWENKYEKKWGKLNLGACIQQGLYGMRGEHGMFEAVSYQLFNLAGVESPLTHWIQLRIIDEVQESPADQYRGDFWGLYLAVEDIGDDFLEEHGLPDGNLYKMDVEGPETEHLAAGTADDRRDVQQFMSALRRSPDPEWWRSNVDLGRYFSYRSIMECVHHYDVGMGKNYYYFNNLKAKRWQVIPWDLDLTWSDQMFGNAAEPFYRTGLLAREPFRPEYFARLAELRDLLYNTEQTGAVIDEYAAVLGTGSPSIAAADRMKWDYHPIMSSQWTIRGRSDPGLFYQNSATGDFKGMTQVMKRYVEQRGAWIDRSLLAQGTFPETPAVAAIQNLEPAAATVKAQLASPKSARAVKWRLAEFRPAQPAGAKGAQAGERGKYEIKALWESEGGATAEIPTKGLEQGHTYRIRARIQDQKGGWSRWSSPQPFTL